MRLVVCGIEVFRGGLHLLVKAYKGRYGSIHVDLDAMRMLLGG